MRRQLGSSVGKWNLSEVHNYSCHKVEVFKLQASAPWFLKLYYTNYTNKMSYL